MTIQPKPLLPRARYRRQCLWACRKTRPSFASIELTTGRDCCTKQRRKQSWNLHMMMLLHHQLYHVFAAALVQRNAGEEGGHPAGSETELKDTTRSKRQSYTCCHSFTLVSALPDTSRRPVLSHAMPLTLSECAALNNATPAPHAASHILMLPSRPPLASMVPRDMYTRDSTAVWRLPTRDRGAPAQRVKCDVYSANCGEQSV